MSLTELIVYACPVGELAAQIEAYRARVCAELGPNEAHRYPPHCSLTGFFDDDGAAIPSYADTLKAALDCALAGTPRPQRAVRIAGMAAEYDPHVLCLESPWLERLAADFAKRAKLAKLKGKPTAKTGLHVTLAWRFPAKQQTALAQLAGKLVDPRAPVSWELRLYEWVDKTRWVCHRDWPLGS